MKQHRFQFLDQAPDECPGLTFDGQLREDLLSLMAQAISQVCLKHGVQHNEIIIRTIKDHGTASSTESDRLSATVITETGEGKLGEPETPIRDD